jgi:hypothetical protein
VFTCRHCFAEIASASGECFSCGRPLEEGPKSSAGEPPTAFLASRSDFPGFLPPGSILGGRFTVQRSVGEQDGWHIYLAVDHDTGSQCWLKAADREDRSSGLETLLGLSGHRRFHRIVHASPEPWPHLIVGPQPSTPPGDAWRSLSEEGRIQLFTGLLSALGAAHAAGRASLRIVPCMEWFREPGPLLAAEASSPADPEGVQSDLRSACLSLFWMAGGEYPASLPSDLSSLGFRLARLVRRCWSGRFSDAASMQRETIGSLGPTGIAPLSSLARPDLSRHAGTEAVLCNDALLSGAPATLLLRRGAASGSSRCLRGIPLLQTSYLAAGEAGVVLGESPLVDWLYGYYLHGRTGVLETLLSQPAADVADQIGLAALASLLGQEEQARMRIGAAIGAAATPGDWLAVASVLQGVFSDQRGGDEARRKAKEVVGESGGLEDLIALAVSLRWEEGDLPAASGVLDFSASTSAGWLRLAEAKLAVLGDGTGADSCIRSAIGMGGGVADLCMLLVPWAERLGPREPISIWLAGLEAESGPGEQEAMLPLLDALGSAEAAASLRERLSGLREDALGRLALLGISDAVPAALPALLRFDGEQHRLARAAAGLDSRLEGLGRAPLDWTIPYLADELEEAEEEADRAAAARGRRRLLAAVLAAGILLWLLLA